MSELDLVRSLRADVPRRVRRDSLRAARGCSRRSRGRRGLDITGERSSFAAWRSWRSRAGSSSAQARGRAWPQACIWSWRPGS